MNICERLQAYGDPGKDQNPPPVVLSQKYNILLIALPTNVQRIP